MSADTELATLRQKYYSLLVRLLWSEPEPDFVRSLIEGIEERAAEAAEVTPLLAEGWRAIHAFLIEQDAEVVADEFTRMFIGPYQPVLSPYESYYLTGGLFQAPLVAVRQFMRRVGLEKKEGELAEPEDILAFELEIMNWLISKQLDAETVAKEEDWLDLQAEFLKKHLLVWGPACAEEIERAKNADFYQGVGKLLRGFLEFEKQIFQNRGPEKVESLAEARRHHGGKQAFKGKLFEPELPDGKADQVE